MWIINQLEKNFQFYAEGHDSQTLLINDTTMQTAKRDT